MTATGPQDIAFMQRALELARLGTGRTSPNPMVGAVIVRDGKIVAEGYHRYFGGDHAEVDAIKNAKEEVAGATMYVTLEPCHHYGKTPPCVDALIQHRISRVVIGMLDPDTRTAGKSVRKLEESGIEVTTGVLEEECRALNEAYIKHRTTGIPFITLKWAQSLDGRIATAAGDSRWISSPESRKMAHELRATHDAIMVGARTVRTDDPELTVRLVEGRNPLRVVLDSHLRIPHESKITDTAEACTLIAVTGFADHADMEKLRKKGVEILELPENPNREVDLNALLEELGKREITSVLVEGGASVLTAFIAGGLADRLVVFIAPKIIGYGIEAAGNLDIDRVSDSIPINIENIRRAGPDIVVEGRFVHDPRHKR